MSRLSPDGARTTLDQAPALRAALRRLIEEVGNPSQTEIVKSAERAGHPIKQQTLSEHLSKDARRLPNFNTIMAIVDGCQEYARRTRPGLGLQLQEQGRFDRSRWEALRAQVEHSSVDSAWPRVRDVRPVDAGVKIAAALPGSSSPIALWLDHRGPRSGIPSYVPRGHDTDLRTTLSMLLEEGTGAVILTGRSCTGKSRSAWEAVSRLARDWLFVDMRYANEAGRLLEAQQLEGNIVLWLDDLRPGSGVAAAVQSTLAILKDRRRRYGAVAIATMWHSPAVGSVDASTALADSLALKELAAYAGPLRSVAEAWTEKELADGRAIARDDALLAVALQQTTVSPPQLMAGSQWAISRWSEPRLRETRAVLTAAIDFSRLGFGVDPATPLTLPMLRDTTPAYLERPPSHAAWFEQALAEATEPLEDAVWALRPPLPGRDHPYVVFDSLLEYGRLVRFHEPLPAKLWTTLADAPLTRDAFARLANTAERRLLREVSLRMHEAALRAEPAAPVTMTAQRPATVSPLPSPTPSATQEPIKLPLDVSPRQRADHLLAGDRYDDLVELAIPSGDTYVRRRLAKLYERRGEIEKLRALATFSNRAGRHLVEHLCSTGDLRELLRMVASGDGHARRAVESWTITGLTEADRRRIVDRGLHPDGSPVADIQLGI